MEGTKTNRSKHEPFSMYDNCHDVAALLSDAEWEQYLALPREQKNMMREYAHDATVNAIFKMMHNQK